jgi:hypothetical protein
MPPRADGEIAKCEIAHEILIRFQQFVGNRQGLSAPGSRWLLAVSRRSLARRKRRFCQRPTTNDHFSVPVTIGA